MHKLNFNFGEKEKSYNIYLKDNVPVNTLIKSKKYILIDILEYKNVPRRIKISDSRKPIYYSKRNMTKKLKYELSKGIYTLDNKGYLLDNEKNKLLKNKNVVGKPKYITISLNSVLSGNIHYMLKNKIVNNLQNYFSNNIKDKVYNYKYPIHIYWSVYMDLDKESHLKDLSNLSVYNKIFEDTLIKEGYIKDDNYLYISKSASPYIINIKHNENLDLGFTPNLTYKYVYFILIEKSQNTINISKIKK